MKFTLIVNSLLFLGFAESAPLSFTRGKVQSVGFGRNRPLGGGLASALNIPRGGMQLFVKTLTGKTVSIEVEEGEFLLKTEPDVFVFMAVEGLGGY